MTDVVLITLSDSVWCKKSYILDLLFHMGCGVLMGYLKVSGKTTADWDPVYVEPAVKYRHTHITLLKLHWVEGMRIYIDI